MLFQTAFDTLKFYFYIFKLNLNKQNPPIERFITFKSIENKRIKKWDWTLIHNPIISIITIEIWLGEHGKIKTMFDFTSENLFFYFILLIII